MKISRMYVAGWWPATVLHLQELYHYLQNNKTPNLLDVDSLEQCKKTLGVLSVEYIYGELDHVLIYTEDKYIIIVYEDGLVAVSGTVTSSVKVVSDRLINYFTEAVAPFMQLLVRIEQLSAQTPQTAILVNNAKPEHVWSLFDDLQVSGYSEVKNDSFALYQADHVSVLDATNLPAASAEQALLGQLFLRQANQQLHDLLNKQREVWQMVSEIKAKVDIKGKQISSTVTKLEDKSKQVAQAKGVLNHIKSAGKVRSDAIANMGTADKVPSLVATLGDKHRTLTSTIDHLQQSLKMTSHYLQTTIDMFTNIHSQSTTAAIKVLTIITSMGVGASLLMLLADRTPSFTIWGILYILALLVLATVVHVIVKIINKQRRYKVGVKTKKQKNR